MLQDKNHFTIFAENSQCFPCTQQFMGCRIVFGLPALACFEMWPGVVTQLPICVRKTCSVGQGTASQSSQHCLSVSVSEPGKSLSPWGLTPEACSSSATWQGFSRWREKRLLSFLPLALALLPSILYHVCSAEWWITGRIQKPCCLFRFLAPPHYL